jgi:murein DD-endopeptidase MepM/ murein hydrolase activator NlpD
VRTRARLALPLLIAALALPAKAAAAGVARVAALQVALRAHGLYLGPIDGVQGPGTVHAVRRLQRRAGIRPDGVAGPRTRRALGRLGRPLLGRRALGVGSVGWDVAELQFLLAWHGFPSGPFDGAFGARTDQSLRRFQRWAHLAPDGRAGPATYAALSAPTARCPIALAWPLQVPVADRFGPRGNRFHAGIDLPAPHGTGVAAAGAGRVAYAGYRAGGWGNLVTIAHRAGVRTMYAHLSRVDVRVGQRVGAGFQVGLVGATGDATGPHLHFEVRLRGAAVDPLTGL